MNDPDLKWIGPWFPVKGDRLVPTIQTENWDAFGQVQKFPCGTFGVDDFSFKGGPVSMTLEALALPADTSFKTQDRTETFAVAAAAPTAVTNNKVTFVYG